jgi:cytochrome P450
VSEFTALRPIFVFLTLMGLPLEDRHILMPVANYIVHASEPGQIQEAQTGLIKYAEAQVIDRRSNSRNDLITKLTNAQVDGKTIEHNMLVGMLALVLSGGLDTVKNLMGFSCLGLARRSDLRR